MIVHLTTIRGIDDMAAESHEISIRQILDYLIHRNWGRVGEREKVEVWRSSGLFDDQGVPLQILVPKTEWLVDSASMVATLLKIICQVYEIDIRYLLMKIASTQKTSEFIYIQCANSKSSRQIK